jgi:selenocysteine lyase/cysteine desulfurase
VAHVTHFNNAGAALPPRVVVETVTDHLWLEARVGGYEAADMRRPDLRRFYEVAAAFVNGAPEEIAFTENATRAWDMAFFGIALADGDRILVSKAEYASNVIAMLHAAQRVDVSIEVIPDDDRGQVCVDALSDLMDERVRLVAVTHVPTQGGLVNPAAEIGAVVRDSDALYLLDTCQSVGQLAVDVQAIGCDAICVTGRKFLRGPRGTGFLWVSERAMPSIDPPMPDLLAAEWTAPYEYELRSDARRYETWEASYAGKLGLLAALEYARGWGLDAIEDRVTALAATLRSLLATVPGVWVHDRGERQCGIVSFTVDGFAPEDVSQALRERQINTSVSTLPSGRFDLEERHLDAVVRASVHYYNTEQELTRLVGAISDLRPA